MTPEFSKYQPLTSTPVEFPRTTEHGAVSGAATKFLARYVDGRYLVGDTQDETRERYVACCSLVSDLIAYCQKKQTQDAAALHKRVTEGLKNSPHLELTSNELDWVLRELSIHLHWQFSGEDQS